MRKLVFKNIIFALTIVLMMGLAIGLSACNDVPDNNQGQTSYCKHDDPSQIVLVDAVAPTCTEPGLTNGMQCNCCGTMVLPQTIVPTLNHDESDWIVDRKTTISKEGLRHTECTTCGKILQQEICQGTLGLNYVENNGTYEVSGSPIIDNEAEIIIPATYNGIPVTSISERAFCDYNNLTSIVIPNSVTSIDSFAFSRCSNLASITIPNRVTSIGASAFCDCRSLASITIPNRVTSIGDSAFKNCNNLISITIPDSITSIGNYAFQNCSSLTSIRIPDSVTSIGEAILGGCSSLTSVTLPFLGPSENGATESYPLGCIFGFNSYEGGVSTTQNRYSPILGLVVNYYYIPASLKTVTITGGNSLCGSFENCKSLTTITLPDSVKNIGSHTFSGCSSLENITIPDSVTSIGYCAFEGCSSLTSITIPDSVTSIGDSVFAACDSLTNIMVQKGNTTYHSAGNCIIETQSKTLIAGCKVSTIPTDGSVTSIGDYAFYKCSGLTSITIPDSVTSIGGWAFEMCKNLTSVIIPDSVIIIGYWAFAGCSSLKSITIPDSVTRIRDWAFYFCSGLMNITFEGSVKQWNTIGFGDEWNYNVPATVVVCSDGVVKLN